MKRIVIPIVFLLSFLSLAQENQNHLFELKLGETTHQIGGYVAIGGRYTTLNSEEAGFADIKAALTFNHSWSIGVSATGLYYDKALRGLVNDGTYHLYIGYTALFVEKMFELSDNFRLNLAIQSGSGEAYYRYDKDFRETKAWYEEDLDKETIYIFEPSIELLARVYGNWWVGATGSFRNTSPLNLLGTDDKLIQNFEAGISFKYGIL